MTTYNKNGKPLMTYDILDETIFERRLSEDPEFFNQYCKRRIKELDSQMMEFVKDQANRAYDKPKASAVQKPLPPRPKPRAANNLQGRPVQGTRSAAGGRVNTRQGNAAGGTATPANRQPPVPYMDPSNSKKLKEASRSLDKQLSEEEELNKIRKEHFMKTAKEYNIL